MASLNELAKKYAEQLKRVNRSQYVSELNKIKQKIDELHYEGTFRSLTDEDKDKICEGIKSEFVSSMHSFSRHGYGTFAESSNDELIKLIDMILKGHKNR